MLAKPPGCHHTPHSSGPSLHAMVLRVRRGCRCGREHQQELLFVEVIEVVHRGVWGVGCESWGVGRGVCVVGCGPWGVGRGLCVVGCGSWGVGRGCGSWGVGRGGVRPGVWDVGRGVWAMGCAS